MNIGDTLERTRSTLKIHKKNVSKNCFKNDLKPYHMHFQIKFSLLTIQKSMIHHFKYTHESLLILYNYITLA